MTVLLELRQVSTVEPGTSPDSGALYKVLNTVVYAETIPKKVFVMNIDNDYFEHVATLWHMQHIPDTKEESERVSCQFYRHDVASRQYDTVATAMDFAEYTRVRIEGLVNVYATAAGEFPGTFDYTFTEE